jgi:hypothetical protein
MEGVYGLEEGFGEFDPLMASLFDEVWSVADDDDARSEAGCAKPANGFVESDGEVDSAVNKKRKLV